MGKYSMTSVVSLKPAPCRGELVFQCRHELDSLSQSAIPSSFILHDRLVLIPYEPYPLPANLKRSSSRNTREYDQESIGFLIILLHLKTPHIDRSQSCSRDVRLLLDQFVIVN